MIFTDPLFVVAILLPFAAFAVVDRGVELPFAIRLSFVLGLSTVYYWYGPSASMPLLGAYVVGNYVLLRLAGDSERNLVFMALLNIAALFYIKATYPGGAPLGISFHAFQIVGLLVARIKRPAMPMPGYVYFLLLLFFPQLAAGPIVHWNHAHRFFERWRNRTVGPVNVDWVVLFLAIGLAKKCIVADGLYPAVARFQAADQPFDRMDSILFPLVYSIYLYMDFSAYSDIATGIARMIGMRMPINFFSPYQAANPATFWRRWHRTLYKFLRNDLRYLYSRLRLPSGTAFLAFVFLFSGYWHGAAWGYMLWAIGHFFYFRFYPRRFFARLPLFARVLTNFVVVSLLWLPFALGAPGLLRWWGGLTGPGALPAASLHLTSTELLLVAIGAAVALLAPNAFQLARSPRHWTIKRSFAVILLVLSLHRIFGVGNQSPAFVYFQF